MTALLSAPFVVPWVGTTALSPRSGTLAATSTFAVLGRSIVDEFVCIVGLSVFRYRGPVQAVRTSTGDDSIVQIDENLGGVRGYARHPVRSYHLDISPTRGIVARIGLSGSGVGACSRVNEVRIVGRDG